MTKPFRLFLFFLLGFFLSGSLVSHASFPATYQYQDVGWNFCGPTGDANCSAPTTSPGLSWATMKSVADSVAQAWTGKPSGYSYYGPNDNWPSTQAGTTAARAYVWKRSGYADYMASMRSYLNGCPAGYGPDSASGKCKSSTLLCPTNSTLGGASCTCNTGYTENGSSCQATCPATSTVYSTGLYDMGTSSAMPSGWAYRCAPNGCAIGFSGSSPAATSLVGGVLHYYAEGKFAYWGPEETCTPGESSASPSVTTKPAPTCAAGQFYAVVNGIGKCFDQAGQATSSEPEKTKTSTTQKTTNPDGSTTINTTTTNNYTGQTTNSSTTYAPGADVPTVPDTSTTPLDDAETEPVDECADNPDRVGCSALGDAPAAESLGTQSVVPTSLTPVSLGGSYSCPADIPLPHGAAFSWQPACDFASGLRPVILALAWLAAATIVLGAKQNG